MAMPTVATVLASSSTPQPSPLRPPRPRERQCLRGKRGWVPGRRAARGGDARERGGGTAPAAAEGCSRQEHPAAPAVEISVTCYQILGVTEKAEKDEVVKSAVELKKSEIEDAYTEEVSTCRQALLVDVRYELLFEQEYAGSNFHPDPFFTYLGVGCRLDNLYGFASSQAPETILCLSHLSHHWIRLVIRATWELQVREEKLVLDIGKAALQRPDSKPYAHDLLLAMALAECSIAKASFEK